MLQLLFCIVVVLKFKYLPFYNSPNNIVILNNFNFIIFYNIVVVDDHLYIDIYMVVIIFEIRFKTNLFKRFDVLIVLHVGLVRMANI